MQIPLTGGAYEARSIIASAQRCVNLYAESNPEGSPFPFTYYPTPGLALFGSADVLGIGRGVWRASNGELYAAIGTGLYLVDSGGNKTLLGAIASGASPVSMADNGLCLILVDGTTTGYVVDLASHAFAVITDPLFLGATRVEYLDTYFIFNRPGTNQWYISLSNVTYLMFLGGPIESGTISNAGSGYGNLPAPPQAYPGAITYLDVPLTGGFGNGAEATIILDGLTGAVSQVTLTETGTSYRPGDALTAVIGGHIASFTILNAGADYTDGVFLGQPMQGGSGRQALANLTIAGGTVTVFSFGGATQWPGIQYEVGDRLTYVPSDGNGAGFEVEVTAVTATTGAGFAYDVQTVESGAFDPLDIAAKTAYPDPLVAAVVMHREVYLVGTLKTEVWYNTGAADFTFGIMPGTYIEHGCIATYSIATQDIQVFWLSQDKEGNAMVIACQNYQAKRVSTHAMEKEFSSYTTIADAVGFCYQQEGHVFYVLNFPNADKTWVYDVATEQWHQRASIDEDGNLKRARPMSCAQAFGKSICMDWQTGVLYTYDLNVYKDNGETVPRIRGFPDLQSDGKRVTYNSFQLAIQAGAMPLTTPDDPPQIWIRWSDDYGASWGNAVTLSLGAAGQFLTRPTVNRLGIGCNRVFETGWSVAAKTALSGAYVEAEACKT